MVYKIKEIEKTCSACPSQWEGTLDNGKMIYIRYRWGYLSVRISNEPTNNPMNAVNGIEIFGLNYGDGFDGVIELDKVLELAKDVIKM